MMECDSPLITQKSPLTIMGVSLLNTSVFTFKHSSLQSNSSRCVSVVEEVGNLIDCFILERRERSADSQQALPRQGYLIHIGTISQCVNGNATEPKLFPSISKIISIHCNCCEFVNESWKQSRAESQTLELFHQRFWEWYLVTLP